MKKNNLIVGIVFIMCMVIMTGKPCHAGGIDDFKLTVADRPQWWGMVSLGLVGYQGGALYGTSAQVTMEKGRNIYGGQLVAYVTYGGSLVEYSAIMGRIFTPSSNRDCFSGAIGLSAFNVIGGEEKFIVGIPCELNYSIRSSRRTSFGIKLRVNFNMLQIFYGVYGTLSFRLN